MRNPIQTSSALQEYKIATNCLKYLLDCGNVAHLPFNWSFGDLMTSFKMANKILKNLGTYRQLSVTLPMELVVVKGQNHVNILVALFHNDWNF